MDYCIHEALDPAAATSLIRQIARLGTIRYSKHCRLQSMPDRSFTFQDLVAVLLNGEVREPPELDEKTGDFKYRVEGNTIDGDETVVVTVFVDHRTLSVLTVF